MGTPQNKMVSNFSWTHKHTYENIHTQTHTGKHAHINAFIVHACLAILYTRYIFIFSFTDVAFGAYSTIASW